MSASLHALPVVCWPVDGTVVDGVAFAAGSPCAQVLAGNPLATRGVVSVRESVTDSALDGAALLVRDGVAAVADNVPVDAETTFRVGCMPGVCRVPFRCLVGARWAGGA